MFKSGHELEEIGITGYPEGHPFLRDETLRQALYEKRPYATYIVSQICFDPETTSGWIRGVRERGWSCLSTSGDTRCCKQAQVDADIF